MLASVADEQQATFETLATSLTAKFLPLEATETAQAELESRRQKPGERLVELHSDIRRLAERAFPELDAKAREIFEKKQFLVALLDKRVRMDIKKANLGSYESCLTQALHCEAVYKAEDGQLKANLVSHPQPSNPQVPEWFKTYTERQDKILESQGKILAQLVEKNETGPRRQKGPCFDCGEMGHLRRDCRRSAGPRQPRMQMPQGNGLWAGPGPEPKSRPAITRGNLHQ